MSASAGMSGKAMLGLGLVRARAMARAERRHGPGDNKPWEEWSVM